MFDIRDAIGGDVPKRARHILLSLGGDYKSEYILKFICKKNNQNTIKSQ